jgi:Ca2+-binding EF-hand superfamily protein
MVFQGTAWHGAGQQDMDGVDGLSDDELALLQQSGLSNAEITEACHLFHIRVANGLSDCGEALTIEDVDVLLRQMRLFMSVRCLWALFMEIDDNVDGKVQISEFVTMVAKLRGRSSMSHEFYERSLPRAVKDRYTKVFKLLSGEDQTLERDDLVTGCRELQNHIKTDSEDFQKAIEDINPNPKPRFSLMDFLVLQAKLRKPPPEIEVALLSLTDEEYQRFADVFQSHREAHGVAIQTPPDLRAMLLQVGFPLPMEQVRRAMQNAELDGTRPMHLREFLYILVTIGAGTSDRPRRILLPGASYEEAFRMGFPLKELWELGYDDLMRIKQAGWSPRSVWEAGLAEAWQLRQVGYCAADLRKLGCHAQQLKLAGFSLEELRIAGFSSEALRDCSSVLSKHRPARKDEDTGISLVLPDIMQKGGLYGEKRWWTTPRIKAMLDGDNGEKKADVKARPVTAPVIPGGILSSFK